jgi:predicted metal-dependent hydrolase
MQIVEKNGKILPYQIIIKKNKNSYFRIRNGILVVTTNRLTSKKTILSYIDLKFEQFYDQLMKDNHQEPMNEIMLWGQPYALLIESGRFAYVVESQQVYVRSQLTDVEMIKKRIYLAELKKALINLLPPVETVVQSHGISPKPIKLKYLKSKFGSYHRKHMEITLNTFLARLNPIYTEYVLYHEYAHAKVFNHSKHFYHLLGELMPKHKEYQKALKTYVIS